MGFIITAFGLIISLTDETQKAIVRNFAIVFIILVILFVLAVIFTILSSLIEKYELWTFAQIIYIMGWVVLGTSIILILVGYGIGINSLQIQLPEFDIKLVSGVSIFIAIINAIIYLLVLMKKITGSISEINERSKKLKVSNKEKNDVLTQLQFETSSGKDFILSIRRQIKIELERLCKLTDISIVSSYPIRKMVTKLKQKKKITPTLAYSMLFFFNSSSSLIHGKIKPQKEVDALRDLGIKTLISLKKISKEVNENG